MNILTFDIEEWFHIKFDNNFLEDEMSLSNYESRLNQNMEFIFDALDSSGKKGTFFCLGWVARKYPKIIKKIDSLGHEIGSHSNNHKLLFKLNREELREDIKISKNSIEDLIGKKIDIYRAPSFSLGEKNSWMIEELIDFEIKYDCSIFPATRENGGFPSFVSPSPCLIKTKNNCEIKEFPINFYNLFGKNIIFSGGGYFRIFPYFMIKKMMKESSYVMTYFHPRDFDPDQPVLKDISLIRYIKSYIGLKSSKNKLVKLLNDFKFECVSEASNIIDWKNVPIQYI
jgi:polysaccharide deacetylase family protein (PEP-CTERM system associated)